MKLPFVFAFLAAVLAVPAVAEVAWGTDFANGSAGPIVDAIRPELVAIVKAPEAERAALIAALIRAKAASHIEALKRFRNPELLPLFRALLDEEDWKLRHRGLMVLECYGDESVLPRAWAMLGDPQPRMREKAAISCIKLWGKGAGVESPGARLQELIKKEESLHVRRCLEALEQRVTGKLQPEQVHEEFVRTDKDGLMIVPVIDGFNNIATEAPGFTAKQNNRPAGRSADKLPVAARWATPMLMWGMEEVKGATLQPFANPRENGVVHTGQDVGASMEGCGFYSCADGVVRFVSTGSDMGTLIVVAHHLAKDELVCSLYMHGGNTIFVDAGDEVKCGQLLTTEGMGFSIENGGHYAHLHHGLYPGDFQLMHNYGYKPASAGLKDWLDPAEMITQWVEETAPLVEARPMGPELDKVVALIEKASYGKAYPLAVSVRDESEEGSQARLDATALALLLAGAPAKVLARATAKRDRGYPGAALDLLKESAKGCEGIPGADSLDDAVKEWSKDAALKKAQKGEAEMDATAAKLAKMKAKDQAAQAPAVWKALLERYGDTCMKGRIEKQLENASSE